MKGSASLPHAGTSIPRNVVAKMKNIFFIFNNYLKVKPIIMVHTEEPNLDMYLK